MRRDSAASVLVLVVLATLGLAGPAVAQHQVPFHGVFERDYTVTPIPDTPTATLVVSASGHGSQVGAFDLEIPHLVNFATASATGDYLMTAANGDMVYLDGSSTIGILDGNPAVRI
jgi:hypothetical protein